jgi:chromosome segregation ATPase
MNPLSSPVGAPSPETLIAPRRSYLDNVTRCCVLLPIPLLGLVGCGSGGFPFILAFGGNTLQASGYVAVAWSAAVSAASFFSCGCYYKNLPERSLEENLQKQDDANQDLKVIVNDVDINVQALHLENDRLKMTLAEADVAIKSLKNELLVKDVNLGKLFEQLNATLKQLDVEKEDSIKMQATITDAKKLIASMIDMSKAIQSNIKTSKVALELFKGCNSSLDKDIKKLDFEKQELSELLKSYSQIVNEEHTQFGLLLNACDRFDQTCKDLKKELDEFTTDGQQFSENVDRDIKNTKRLEALTKQLADLTKELSTP